MGDEAQGFTAEQEDMLHALLDEVIPPSADGRLPGAGGLDLIGHVVRTVRQMPMLAPVVQYGLSAIAELAGTRSADGWAGLSRAERSALLAEFAAGDQLFMPALLFLAYSGYYQHPRVVEALGLEARPPHPQGYAMEPFDTTLLDAVRRRGKIYRDV
jgi:Gluconate 2-dehydrogenase subunit 3